MIGQLKSVSGDNRGVSPVIGVILMVAITVILAAVIGSFVLNLGGNLQQAPQAQISMEDASDGYGPTDGNAQDAFTISQNGGDSLTLGDLRIVLSDTGGGSNDATFESGSWETTNSGTTVAVQKGGTDVTDSATLGVGEELTIRQTADDPGSQVLATGEYEITIVHTPSDTILAESTVTLE